jgi:hypothetical protein
VRRRFDPATFVRFRQGLERAAGHRSALRSVLLGEREPSEDPDPAVPALPDLDEAQRRAAHMAWRAEQLAVIHGPPGTGKTRVLAALLEALVAAGERPWALADSNAATDHLAVKAAARGLAVLRLGHPSRLGSEAAALSLQAWLERSPLGPALATLERELSRAWGTPAARGLLAQRRQLRDQAFRHALDNAEVLALTFGTLARLGPELPAARTAVVDEATQATEPAVWTAVPWVERLILAGDPHQLGPVTKVPGSVLATSLLQRWIGEGHAAPMLEVQRRMHADIRGLVADVYGPTYVDHRGVAGHRLSDLPGVSAARLPAEGPVTWVDTAGAPEGEQVDPVTRSRFNPTELQVVALAVAGLRRAGVTADDIGVITPYSAQVARLRQLPALEGVECASVNAFQGREKEALVCSFVRSNPEGALGFVQDERRLTVALTRARRWLLCVGDTATLGRAPRMRAVIDHIEAMGWLRSVWEPPWEDVL